MANGFKVFAVGEVLTASDVNDYLMEQSISIFADVQLGTHRLHHLLRVCSAIWQIVMFFNYIPLRGTIS